jgi:hypothetical protein
MAAKDSGISQAQDVHWVKGKNMAAMTDNGGGRRGISWRVLGWGGAALLLLLPLAAMQFSDEMNWTAFDFIFLSTLLGAIGLGVELAARKSGSIAYRIGTAVALAAACLLLIVNGAVGIIGSEQGDANLLYLGVIALAFVGAIVARFRASGMAWAMATAALAVLLVPVIAAIFGLASPASMWAPEVPASSFFFAGMWLLSAALYRKAARQG